MGPRNGMLLLGATLILSLPLPRLGGQDPPAGDGAILPPAEITRIVSFDTVTRHRGEPLVGTILTDDPESAGEIIVRSISGTTTFGVPSSDIKSIERRRTAADVYREWLAWLRRNVKERKRLGAAELALAKWCHTPHPELDGERPQAAAALLHFRRAVILDPSLKAGYGYLLALYTKLHTVEACSLDEVNDEIEVYLLALDAGHEDPAVYFRLGVLLAHLGQLDRAEPYLEKVLESGDTNRGRAGAARKLLAEAFVARGDWSRALELYTVSAEGGTSEEAPARFNAFFHRGRLRLRQGGAENRRLAREDFLQALSLQPHFVDLRLYLAAIDYADGDLAAARTQLKTYVRLRSADVAARVDLAIVESQLGRFSTARKLLAAAVAPEVPVVVRARAHLALGSIHDMAGEKAAALGEYRNAAALRPDDLLPQLLVAYAQAQTGAFDEARRSIDALVAANAKSRPVFSAGSRLLALIESSLGRHDEACTHLEYAAAVSADDPTVLERAGLAFLRIGDLDRGMFYLSQVQTLAPDRPRTLGGFGFYHYQRGSPLDAAPYFEDVIKRTRNEPDFAAERAYALVARARIKDLERLEVWVDDFAGRTPGVIDGWEEIERFGIEVRREGSQVVFQGRQQTVAEGETGLRWTRLVSGGDFDRVAVRLRIDSGRVSPILRVAREDTGRGVPPALSLYADLDGRLRFQLRDAKGELETPVPSTAAGKSPPSRGAKSQHVFPGNVMWPDDHGFHTLEVRRATSKTGIVRPGVFDLFFDGEIVAGNVSASGVSGGRYQMEIYARTDRLDQEYSMTVDNFKLYRVAKLRGKTGRR